MIKLCALVYCHGVQGNRHAQLLLGKYEAL